MSGTTDSIAHNDASLTFSAAGSQPMVTDENGRVDSSQKALQPLLTLASGQVGVASTGLEGCLESVRRFEWRNAYRSFPSGEHRLEL